MVSARRISVRSTSVRSASLPALLLLILWAAAFDYAVKFMTDAMLAVNANQPLLIYLGMVGVYTVLIPAFFLFVLRPRFLMTPTETDTIKPVILLTLFGLAYFAVWMIAGFLLGQHPKDVVGSTARALLPFIVMTCIFSGLGVANSWRRERVFRYFVSVSCVFTGVGAVGKALLLLSGSFYGGGLNQFYIETFVLVWLVLYVFKVRAPARKKLAVIVLVWWLLVLSVLSLKRAVWVNLLFAFALVMLPLNVKQRLQAVLVGVALAAAGVVLFAQLGQIDRLMARYEYTFSGAGAETLDPSTYTRVAEMTAAVYTLNHSPMRIGWLIGLGPGAGYENPEGFPFNNLNEHGEPYHIHSAVGLITFRYGVIGLLLYMSYVCLALRVLFVCARQLRRARWLKPWHPAILGFAAAAGIGGGVPALLTGNVYFGSMPFGVLSVMALYCWVEVRHRERGAGAPGPVAGGSA